MTDTALHRYYTDAAQVAIAAFGGMIGAHMRREARSLRTSVVGGVGAGFVGFLVAKFCHATGVSDDMTYVFVGVSGWLGAARTIDILEKFIEGRLTIQLKPLNAHAVDEKSAPDEEPDAPKAA
jgi:hypothetical protein